MNLTVLLVLAYFAVLAISLHLRRSEVGGRHLHLLRAFFPNWRFYHAVGHRPTLELRWQSVSGVWSDWTPYFPRAERDVWQFLHNPTINLQLVEQTLVEHLAGDLAELSDEEDARELVSYQLTLHLAAKLVRQLRAERSTAGLATERLDAPVVAASGNKVSGNDVSGKNVSGTRGAGLEVPAGPDGTIENHQFRLRLLHAFEPEGDNPTVLISPILPLPPAVPPVLRTQ
jgi:hypothetical protein